MNLQSNELLHYLDQLKAAPAKRRSKYALRLNLSIPSVQLNEVIKQLSKDGYINIFMHRIKDYNEITPVLWEKRISFDLSTRGKKFLKAGGYSFRNERGASMNSAVGF